MVLAGAAVSLIGCKESPYILAPGDNSNNQDSIYVAPDPIPDPDPEGIDIPEGTINVNEARKIGAALGNGEVSNEVYHIKGWVTRLGDKNADGIANYGNAQFYMSASKTGSTKEFYAYQVLGKNGNKLVDVNQVAVGDFVVIEGKITNYKGTIETEGRGEAHIYSSTNELFDPKDPEPTPAPEGADVPEGTLNVYEAVALGQALASGASTPEKYYVMGYVSHLHKDHASGMSGYGNGTFYIAANKDGFHTMEFEAYRVKGKNGVAFDKQDQLDAVKEGDFVIIYGPIKNFSGTIENGDGAYVYYSNNPKW